MQPWIRTTDVLAEGAEGPGPPRAGHHPSGDQGREAGHSQPGPLWGLELGGRGQPLEEGPREGPGREVALSAWHTRAASRAGTPLLPAQHVSSRLVASVPTDYSAG